MLILTTLAIAPAVVFNIIVAKPADGSLNRYEEAKQHPVESKGGLVAFHAWDVGSWGCHSKRGAGTPALL